MAKDKDSQLTLADRVRGWFDADYAARAQRQRVLSTSLGRMLMNKYRSADNQRTDSGNWSDQPWAGDVQRSLSPSARKKMVKRSRHIEENNMLGSSMLDRVVDNVIGEGMAPQPQSNSKRFNQNVEAAMRDWEDQADVRRMMSLSELQRTWYRARIRDGDVGVLLLKSGDVQTIESDFIQSPIGAGDQFHASEPDVIDGIEINDAGRPLAFHVAEVKDGFRRETRRIRQRNLIWNPRLERNHRTAVRGIPLLAQLGPWLNKIDNTTEAVTLAHQMAAMFGIVRRQQNPGDAFSALQQTVDNSSGDSQQAFQLEPGMVEFVGQEDAIEQIKPEHPSTNFGDFMRFVVRLAGLKLGLPLEIALLDFSQTNYSSARASMEQAYRRFRIEQNIFANRVMRRIYRWRVSKWMKDGTIRQQPSDAFDHQWFGQPWPYLDPQKEAEGALVSMDAGFTTLTSELRKRGFKSFNEWLETVQRENEALDDADIARVRSNKTREVKEASAESTSTQDDEAMSNAGA